MLVSKQNRVAVYAYLFAEGVLVVKKDFALPKHPEIDVPNLEVINLMKSLRSRAYVRETFCWKHYYYYLTTEGMDYLRKYLHLPPGVLPSTLQKSTRPGGEREGGDRRREGGGDRRRDGGGRDNYRGDKKLGGGFGDKKPEFVGGGGIGRGGGAAFGGRN